MTTCLDFVSEELASLWSECEGKARAIAGRVETFASAGQHEDLAVAKALIVSLADARAKVDVWAAMEGHLVDLSLQGSDEPHMDSSSNDGGELLRVLEKEYSKRPPEVEREVKLELTEVDARHIHECLTTVKNSETAAGIWVAHNTNAAIRTQIERKLQR